MAKPPENLAQDIFFEAPPAPRRGKKFFVALAIAVVLLAWSFHGAKIRLGELLEGIPQIGQTLARREAASPGCFGLLADQPVVVSRLVFRTVLGGVTCRRR